MPYTGNNYPDRIKALPAQAKKIWIAAFNNAFKEYNGNEKRSNQIAWAAVEKAGYKKDNAGQWKRWA